MGERTLSFFPLKSSVRSDPQNLCKLQFCMFTLMDGIRLHLSARTFRESLISHLTLEPPGSLCKQATTLKELWRKPPQLAASVFTCKPISRCAISFKSSQFLDIHLQVLPIRGCHCPFPTASKPSDSPASRTQIYQNLNSSRRCLTRMFLSSA